MSSHRFRWRNIFGHCRSRKIAQSSAYLIRRTLRRRYLSSLRERSAKSSIELLDAAYWMKGCSSLGRLRFAVLARVEKDKKNDLCLIDIKEAVQVAASRTEGQAMPRYARRVVEGASHLSPYLGKRMLAVKLLGKPVVLRELLSQNLKLEMDRLTLEEIVASAKYFPSVVGKAHARPTDKAERWSWMSDLQKHWTKKLESASWLWASVVNLLTVHERTYLEHCREYALVG
jgi:uncharacterized protein (DUF2252 family)